MTWPERNWLLLPFFINRFFPHFQFNELLKEKVIAAPPVIEPIYSWPLKEKTNKENSNSVDVLLNFLLSVSLINTNDKEPVCPVVKLFGITFFVIEWCIFIVLTSLPPNIHQSSWETQNSNNRQKRKLELPNVMTNFVELPVRFFVVNFTRSTCLKNVDLCAESN